MKLCYAEDSIGIENEMDYIAGKSHNKEHIINLIKNYDNKN